MRDLQALAVVSYHPAVGELGALAILAAVALVHYSPVDWVCNRARDYPWTLA